MTTPPSPSMRRRDGGRVDRSTAVTFTFDGRDYTGHPGDTLASALLANGVRTVARSAELRRPRGVYAAGPEEPNALVRVEAGPAAAPMRRATAIELYDGLRAYGLAGRGVVSAQPDDARYDRAYLHCDVLVVGAGPAGLAAAWTAGRTGARVVVCDEGPEQGGGLLGSRTRLDGESAMAWVDRVRAELAALPEVRVMARTSAVGYYDHNEVVAVQRRTEHGGSPAPVGGGPAAPERVSRQRLWHFRARHVVLATGAHERPIVFADNDRPGVLLASAARTYVNRYGVLPGRRAVVFTANDSAYAAAADLLDAGVEVAAVVDVRPELAARAGSWPAAIRERGVEVLRGHAVVGTDGPDELTAVRVAPHGGEAGDVRDVDCDLLAVSGGWNPAVHLHVQSQGRTRYDEAVAAFVPDGSVQPQRSVGAARGVFGAAAAVEDGYAAGAQAARLAGFASTGVPEPPREDPAPAGEPAAAYWAVPARTPEEAARQFVDLERDATVADVERATDAGMVSIEHVKRYTTVGTASDQGKTSGTVTVGVVSELLGRPVGATGTTTFRPPYVPVPFAVMAGRDRGRLADPERVTAIHDWHLAHGAVFEDVGQWKRPWYFPLGEDGELEDAVLRECRAAREDVAVMDASTLGKIDIQGPDAAEFLDRVYTNRMSTLRVGRCRYGVMCSADGMVLDDGVAARLGDDHFICTTTTGNAAAVLDWLEEWLQTEWPHLRVYCTSVTDHWATVAVVGPRARDVVAALAPGLAVDAESFPFMTFREALLDHRVAGVSARVFRVSFSGELAYEVNVPAWYGQALWEAVMAAGEPYGITPYGTETMHVLRAEKGYPIVGQETDGTVTPQDLGMDWIVSKKKDDFVGRRSHRRPDTARTDRQRLVGLLPEDPADVLPEGAQLVETPGEPPLSMVGRVTSSYRSAALGRSFALALVRGGPERAGERLYVPLVDRTVPVTVTEPVFYDKEGRRRDG